MPEGPETRQSICLSVRPINLILSLTTSTQPVPGILLRIHSLRRKKEEARRKKEEGRRKKEEERRKKEEGRGKKEEGRRKKEGEEEEEEEEEE